MVKKRAQRGGESTVFSQSKCIAGFCSLSKPVTPLLQSQLDGQQFPIPEVIVALCWGEMPGEESARVQLLVFCRTLGQDGPHPGRTPLLPQTGGAFWRCVEREYSLPRGREVPGGDWVLQYCLLLHDTQLLCHLLADDGCIGAGVDQRGRVVGTTRQEWLGLEKGL